MIVNGQQAVVVVVACVLPWAQGIICGPWLSWAGGQGRFWTAVVVFVKKSKRERRGLPELM